jgi:hypothetical protein
LDLPRAISYYLAARVVGLPLPALAGERDPLDAAGRPETIRAQRIPAAQRANTGAR